MNTNDNENTHKSDTFNILDQILSFEGLYERVFWKLLDPIVYDRAIDKDIHFIKEIFSCSDAKDCMTRKVERAEFRWMSKILFKFRDSSNELPK